MMRYLVSTLVTIALTGSGCPQQSTTPTHTASAPNTMSSTKEAAMAAAECTTASELEKAFDTTCRVVGTFDVKDYFTKKNTLLAAWPVVTLSDGTTVLIESLWDKSKRLDDATIASYKGQRVAVTGMLHAEPPGAMANFAEACVSPVAKLEKLTASAP